MKDIAHPESNNTPTWQSPVCWVLAAVGVVMIYSIYRYIQTNRAVVLSYIDVSDSVQPYRKAMTEICEAVNEALIDGDTRIEAKFADRVLVTSNTTHEGKQASGDCQKITQKPEGVGKHPGTDIVEVFQSIDTEVQHQRSQGNKHPVVTILAIQAAEPKIGKKPTDPKIVKEWVQKIAKEGYLSIIGPEVILQSQLSKELVKIPNVKVCTFSQAKDCGIDWAFNQARK
jgi:hypothetical protein